MGQNTTAPMVKYAQITIADTILRKAGRIGTALLIGRRTARSWSLPVVVMVASGIRRGSWTSIPACPLRGIVLDLPDASMVVDAAEDGHQSSLSPSAAADVVPMTSTRASQTVNQGSLSLSQSTRQALPSQRAQTRARRLTISTNFGP